MYQKINCSVGILTFNSDKTLGRALESVKDFNEIIISDGGSTDNTIELARSYGAKILSQNIRCLNTDGTIKDFSCAKNQLLDMATNDWFLVIDSDEAISKGLRDEIRHISSSDKALAYKVPVNIFVEDREIKYSSNYPGYQFRFFNKKSGGRFIRPVHEKVEFPDGVVVGILKYPWNVFFTNDEAQHYIRHNHLYARMQANQGEDITLKNCIASLYGNVFVSIKHLIKFTLMYLRRGFKDSIPVSVEIGRTLYPLVSSYYVIQRYVRHFLSRTQSKEK